MQSNFVRTLNFTLIYKPVLGQVENKYNVYNTNYKVLRFG